jgi:hypothetical protein
LETSDQGFGVDTARLRLILIDLVLRFLRDQQDAHDKTSEQDDQYLPAKFFHIVEEAPFMI